MVGTLVLAVMLAGTQSDIAPAMVALVTTYADGSTSFDLVSARPAWKWTPKFPVIEGSNAPDGVPSALKLTRQLDGRAVKVTVSLLFFGRGTEREKPVATVVVENDAHVVIDALRQHGVQPITLSLATVTPPTPFLPSVFSNIPELEISGVTVLTSPYPGYRITVRNLSDKAAASFAVQSYRGDAKAIGGLRSGAAGHPVLLPMASYSFDLNLTGGDASGPGLLDVIELTSVTWDDGSSAGESASPAARSIPVDAGRRVLLTRVVEILRAAVAQADVSLAELSRQLEAIPDRDAGLLPAAQRSRMETKRMALQDVRRFEQDQSTARGATTMHTWLQMMVRRYESLIARLSPL